MKRVRFTLFEIMLVPPALFLPLALIAVAITTEHDRVVSATAGGMLLICELLGIYWQLIRRGEKLSTTRESLSIVWGGALAGFGIFTVAWLVLIAFNPFHRH